MGTNIQTLSNTFCCVYMNALPIFVWIGTIYFTLVVFLPFIPNRPELQIHWLFRGLAVFLMIFGWFVIFSQHFIH